MYRGSTPTFSFELPFSASDISLEQSIISFEQDEDTPLLEKSLSDCKRSGQVYALTLTQEESFLFETGKATAQINLMMADGKRLPSTEMKFKVNRNLHDEVIEVKADGDD